MCEAINNIIQPFALLCASLRPLRLNIYGSAQRTAGSEKRGAENIWQ
jgi:hypothetical protein